MIGYWEDLIFANFLFWVISLPLYIGGQIVRTSKKKFKTKGNLWVKIYVFIFFALPGIFYLNDYFLKYKKDRLNSEKYIILDLYEVHIFFVIFLVILVGVRIFNDKKKGLLNVLILGTVILLAGQSYYYYSKYSGIHEEIGIVSSDRKGEKEIVPYEEIESVYVKPYIKTIERRKKIVIKTTREYFVWEVVFKTKNQNEMVYEFVVKESHLNATIRLKEVVLGKGIPLIIEEMDKETVAFFENELDISLLEEDRYYDIFKE